MKQEQQWHVLDHAGSECGPYTAEQLRAYAIDGTISSTTQVWAEGLREWIPASQVEGLFGAEPAGGQLLAGSAARGGLSQSGPNRAGFPAGASPTVAQPSSGGTTLIVLVIAIPLLILGAYVVLNQESTDSSTAERTVDNAPKTTESPDPERTAESQGASGKEGPPGGNHSPSPGEVTPAQWEAIAAIEKLGGRFKSRALAELRFTQVSDFPENGLIHLKEFPNLRTLDLDCGVLTNEDLALCKDLTQLTSLSFSGDQITDAGLAHLKNMSHLKSLTMSSTSTTDEGLAHFEQLSELKSVVIYSQEGSITDAGIKGLQAALPSCKIKNEPSDGSSPRVQISTYQEGEFAELVDTQIKLPNSDQELEEFLLGSTWRPSEFDGALLEFEEERMTIMAHVWATKISGRRNVTIHRGELHPGIGTIFDLISPSAYIVFAEDMSSLTVLDGQDLKPKWTASFVRNGADDKSSAE